MTMTKTNSPISPAPLRCTIKDGVKRTMFDREELLKFVQRSDAVAFLVKDETGNQSPILIQPILDSLSESDKSHH
jgi:hypothetical protein